MRKELALLGLICLIGLGCGPEAQTQCPCQSTAEPSAEPYAELAEELYQRGLAVQKQGDVQEAIALYHKAIQADPDHAQVLNHFAWLRATDQDAKLRDATEAVSMAERACKSAVSEDRPTIFAANCLDTLAAAYAEAGRFQDAADAARRAISMAEKLRNRGAVRDFTDRLRLFQQGKPYRE
jgi:tetratricopeptide (TPR) repeat protein